MLLHLSGGSANLSQSPAPNFCTNDKHQLAQAHNVQIDLGISVNLADALGVAARCPILLKRSVSISIGVW